jgi:hypothetical protein
MAEIRIEKFWGHECINNPMKYQIKPTHEAEYRFDD